MAKCSLSCLEGHIILFLVLLLAPVRTEGSQNLCDVLCLGMLVQLNGGNHVRVNFYVKDRKLEPFPVTKLSDATRYPATIKWHMLKNNADLGVIISKASVKGASTFADINKQFLDHDVKLPKLPVDGEISDWSGELLHQPVVLTTGDRFDDPDSWGKSKTHSPKILLRAKNLFRDKNPVMRCDEKDRIVAMDKNYDLSSIKVVSGYKSKSGFEIIGLKREEESNCDGPASDGNFPHWYFVSGTKKPVFLGAKMMPISFVDFLGNGRSIIVFKVSGYNEDGIVLFESNGTEISRMIWHYH